MDARRALMLTNGVVDVRPVVLLAAKVLGPGSLRLEMVKLLHELNGPQGNLLAFAGRPEIPNHHINQPVNRSAAELARPGRAGGYEYTGCREAFPIRVNDFDRLLESSLRRRLDPIVAAPAPVRRGRAASRRVRLIPKAKKTDRDRSANE